jgi:PKD repeat protein
MRKERELLRKTVSGIMLTMLLTSMASSIFIIRPVKAMTTAGIIYIRADGTIYPPDVPIQRNGDIYTFTDNISDPIVVQRSNIVVDGVGYTLHTGGLVLECVENVTVNNVDIRACWRGISLFGLYITITNSILVNNVYGIFANWTMGNVITKNSIMSNTVGLTFSGDNNVIYHNNFVNNTNNCEFFFGSSNQWDDSYPSGGNYWSDYVGVDAFSGPNQDQPSSDGIGDIPYIVDKNNQDRYPLITPLVPPPPLPPPTPPVASFIASATTVYTGEVIRFDASSSYDPDGIIVSYIWDFGDGKTGRGDLTHFYVENGTYMVTLTVTDNQGLMGTDFQYITVLNRPPVAIFTESAENVYPGEIIHFNASQSYDPDGYIVSYFWDFGDGVNTTGITVDHAYVDDGNYTVTLTVADNDGANATATSTKTVLNRFPVASFSENAIIVLTGEAIRFDASSSYDPDGVIVNYLWDFGDGKKAAGIVVQHAYSNDGTYVVTLKVIDDDRASASSTSTKMVINRAPVALFTETAEMVPTGEVIIFDATLSYDSDGTIVDYFWDFGDGTTANGAVVSHAYFDNGTYKVTLVVTDDDGSTASTTSTKCILNRPPVASFTESAETVYTGELITFNASGSYDPDGYIVSYFWDFGNGANASGVVVSYSWVEDGTYTVTLAVTDDDGETTLAYSLKTVLNCPPVASFTESAETVLTAEVIWFDASASYDLDGAIVSYFWDFSDGTNATGMKVSHAYSNDGIYTVTLTVTDNDGATDSVQATKTVLNRAPVASFTESAETVSVGEFITFNALSSFDPDGSIGGYSWDFGDGTTAIGVVVSHAYTAQGTYTVTLTVTDDDGATATVTDIKTVLKPPIASFTWAPLTPKVGEPVSFDGSASKPDGGTIVKYEWIFGDGGYATGKTVMYTYSRIGSYNVTLKVIDSEGLWDTEQKQIVLNVDLPPDLAVSSPDITFSDYNPSENQVITISATIHNVGDGNAKNVKVQFFDTGTLIGEDQISFISYHTSGVASVEWTAARQGFHLMRVIVDPSNTIQETDEENNEATRSVLVGRLVGYGGIEISPSTNSYEAYPGQNITVSGMATYRLKYEENEEIKYYSEPVAGANVAVTIVGEKWLWETQSIVDGRFWVEIGVPYFLGSYEIKVEVTDFTFWENVVYQLVVKQYEGEGGPGGEPVEGIDLTILEWNAPWISFDPSNPLENDVVMVTARIFNIGTIGASNILVRFYEESTIIGERIIDNIVAHDNRSTSIWWKAWSAGWHTITVQVDPYNFIPELNENNNVGSKKIYVYPAWPDLTPTRIELSDWTLVINQLVAITATVTNLGGVEANNVLVRFYDNDTFIGKHVISSILGKGNSKTALISHTFTTAGFHVIKVVVDPENSIIEAREDNNERYCTIYVHLPSIDLTFPSYINADLRGWDITFSNATPTIGDVITISSGIHNVGELEANNVVVKFFDNDTEIGSVHVASIPGNSYQTASVSWNAFPEGLHKITVIIDPDNTVAESNEFNNKATGYINVYSPYEPPSDLCIYSEDIVFSNTNPDRGENVIIYATVHNNGPAPAQNFNVTFYINNRPLDYKTIDSISAEASQTVSIHWRVDVGNGSYVIRVEIDPEYAIRDPVRTNNTATRAIIVGMPPKAPPVASFDYTPSKPIVGDSVTFWASDSYDPDGGVILEYQWELYSLTNDEVIFPPFLTEEKEIVTYTFSSKGDFLMKLTVTDDEGTTASTNSTIRVTNEWTFAIITDLHVGRGYPDYGGKGIGTEDMQIEGQDYYLTERLQKTVEWIIDNRDNYNIRFVVVLGDISDSGEYSELKRAKDILDNLNEENIPYIPVIGNHDLFPIADQENRDQRFFESVFWDQYQKLEQNTAFNFTRQNPELNDSDLENCAFSYKEINFIILDFVSRAQWLGVAPWADLHWDTLVWLNNLLSEGKPTVIFSHHPMIARPFIAFDIPQIAVLSYIINNANNNFGTNILANFAGHIHGFDPSTFMDANEVYTGPAGIPVVTTEAMMVASNEQRPKGIIRLVEAKNGEINNYDIVEGEFPALNPYFKPTASILFQDTLYQEFKAYAFTKIFTEEHPLSYTLHFGDGASQTILSASGEPVKFWHYYHGWSPEKAYDVTLTVRGYTLDGMDLIEEEITKTITFSVSWLSVIAHSPVDIAITDPDGLTISKQLNEIPDSTYVEIDINGDSSPDDVIIIPDRKIGDYLIRIVPEPDVAPTDAYTLEVWIDGITTVLVENAQISNIPTQSYIIRSTETEIIPIIITWEYVFEDAERGTMLKISTDDKYFQFIAPDKDFGIREATYMRLRGRTITIRHEDNELRLITLAVDTKLDFCVAIAWDVQTGKQYFLIDKPGKEYE